MRCVTIISISVLFLVGTAAHRGRAPRRIKHYPAYRGCILPEQPIGGRFAIDSCSETWCHNTPGERVPTGTFLAFSCDEGYALKGNEFTGCRRDEWYLLPTCVKTCPPLSSQSVDIVYEYPCNGDSRSSAIFPGTKATLKCKKFYELHTAYEPGYREVHCLDGGEWDRPVFNCTAECGSAKQGDPLMIGGSTAASAEFPWHVGIYQHKSGGLTQICGGSLVRPDLVFSAAHCFYDERSRKFISPTKFAVAAGKIDRSYYSPEDFSQTSSVEHIHRKDKYYGFDGNYALDIALVRTRKSFVYTTYVRPICIDVENKPEDSDLRRRMGKVSGWGITEGGEPSPKLRQITLPYVPHKKCINAVPEGYRSTVSVDDKFCAGYLNGSSVCKGDSGGGLCFDFRGLWYLRGIVSVGPHPSSPDVACESKYYTVFTNVSHHMDWIRGFLVSSESERTSCALPEKPLNGRLWLGSSSESMHDVPEDKVPDGSSLAYSCDEGYTLKGSNVSRCDGAVWSGPPPICARIRKCQPLKVSKIVNVVCKFKGDTVPCESETDVGTEATVTCPPFYQIPGEKTSTNRSILCYEMGEWDRPAPQCVPECGRGAKEINKEGPGGIPWAVWISWPELVGHPAVGSLVSPDLVITDISYHVARIQHKLNNGTRLVNSLESVTVTAMHWTWSGQRIDQKSDAMSINTADAFVGSSLVTTGRNTRPGHVDPNILLIRLRTPFTMTTWVRPVCIDWGDRQLQPVVNRALIALYADPHYPWTFRGITLLPPGECTADSTVKTKFCVTHDRIPDPVVVMSIVSETDGVWYLRGIVADHNIQLFCDDRTCRYLVTNVTTSIDWIRSVFMESANSALMVNQGP